MNDTCATHRSRVPRRSFGRNKRRSDDIGRRERTRPGFYFMFCVWQSSVRGCRFSVMFVYFVIKMFKCSPVPASFFPYITNFITVSSEGFRFHQLILLWSLLLWLLVRNTGLNPVACSYRQYSKHNCKLLCERDISRLTPAKKMRLSTPKTDSVNLAYGIKFHWTLLVMTELMTIVAFGKRTLDYN